MIIPKKKKIYSNQFFLLVINKIIEENYRD